MVFTTHTPEAAGNEEHDCHLLHRMGFFSGLSMDDVKKITGHNGGRFSLTVGALKLSKISNAVSKLHGDVANEMWADCENRCPIIYITNAQNKKFWADKHLCKTHTMYTVRL